MLMKGSVKPKTYTTKHLAAFLDCIFRLFCFQYFVANSDNKNTVRHYLNPRIRARYVRFVPVTWHNWICMRVEIYGCDAGESKLRLHIT